MRHLSLHEIYLHAVGTDGASAAAAANLPPLEPAVAGAANTGEDHGQT
jgi:hypothetical protein